jgi:histidine triad (HIT) family protein
MLAVLLRIWRSPLGRWSVGWIMAYLNEWLPVDRLYETPCLLAFKHPIPVYSTHILIIPKKSVASLLSLNKEEEDFASQFMSDLLGCVQRLVDDYKLESSGYRLIVNGGKYQDVPQLHFHLVSGKVKD